MITPTRLLTTLVLTLAAILTLAACNFITTPPVGGPGGGDAAPTEPPATSPPAPPATAIVPATAVQPGAAGAPGAAATVMVMDGRSIKQWSAPPPLTIDTSASYTAVLNTTAGPITVELLTGDAPNTVNNFVFLARDGFYNNVIFHRTIPGFMIQGGDPTGTGGGGPRVSFRRRAGAPSLHPRDYAMANAGPTPTAASSS